MVQKQLLEKKKIYEQDSFFDNMIHYFAFLNQEKNYTNSLVTQQRWNYKEQFSNYKGEHPYNGHKLACW